MLPLKTLMSIGSSLSIVWACSLHNIAPTLPTDLLRRSTLPGEKQSTMIKNVHVFDGWRMDGPRDICFHGEKISLSPCITEKPKIVVDGTGKFLIPGLIDSHLHISKVSDLEILTSYGVTTGIHMACQGYEVCRAFRNQTDLTSIIFAGTAGTGTGNPDSNMPQPGHSFPDLDEAVIISNVFNNGSDMFKVAIEDNGPSQSVLNSLIEEVHKAGHQAMTHATSLEAFAWAITSKTDGIQHIASDGLLTHCLVERILENSQFVTPTMNIFKLAFENPLILAILRPDGPGNATYDAVINNVKRLHEAGVPILAGTDAVGVITPAISVPFGLTMHWELSNLVSAGLSPAEALRAATVMPAMHHKLSDRGVIEPGRRADLVLLNSDPLEDIVNTLDIDRVWVMGTEFEEVAKAR